jgi:hypothetical protein
MCKSLPWLQYDSRTCQLGYIQFLSFCSVASSASMDFCSLEKAEPDAASNLGFRARDTSRTFLELVADIYIRHLPHRRHHLHVLGCGLYFQKVDSLPWKRVCRCLPMAISSRFHITIRQTFGCHDCDYDFWNVKSCNLTEVIDSSEERTACIFTCRLVLLFEPEDGGSMFLSLSLSLSLILRPTVSRPVYLGIKHPSGAFDQICMSLTIRALFLWASSLTRGRV